MEDLIIYLCELLNINTKNKKFIIQDMRYELMSVKHLDGFAKYIRDNANSARFDYANSNFKTGFQKFIILAKEYKAEFEDIELSENDKIKIYSYADKLFSKVTTVFDEINFLVQTGKDLHSEQMTRFIYANFEEKDRKVLKLIGNRNRLLFMARNNREALRTALNDKINYLSLQKRKSLVGVSNGFKSDNEIKILELVKGRQDGK